MRRAFGLVTVTFLGICTLAIAAYTVMTAVASFAFMSPLGVLVVVTGVLMTIVLMKLMKRIAAYTFSR